MKLPNAEKAVVDIAKLRDYCLNPNHPKGKHKARVFLEKLAITKNDAEQMCQVIREAILRSEATEHEPTAHGRRFTVDLEISWTQRIVLSTAVVSSAWIIRNNEDFPRLTICFIPQRSNLRDG